MTMMELRVTGKRTAVGAHRGQAVLFVFHAGASKRRDVFVWDADKGKPACMLRGLGEEEWKQYVQAERPFPTSPCGYLGFDEKPRHQRGFGSRLAHNGQQQTQDGGRGQQKTGRQDALSRSGVQGSQGPRKRGAAGGTWVRKDAGKSNGREREHLAQQRTEAPTPPQC